MKKVKAKLSKDSYSNLEMERYLGALNEMHGETLKGINENFVLVNKKLDSHTEAIGELKVYVWVLKEDMQIVKGDLSVIKSDLKKRVDYDEFMSLVKRVQKIEAKI